MGAGGVPLPVIAGAATGTGAAAMVMPWRRSFHETRLLMTVAMAFFSIALTLNLMGVKMGSLKLADLKPSQIGSTVSRQFYGARSSVVRYYDNMRFFYQLQSRMRELRRDVETQQPQQNNQQQPGNQQNQQQQKPGGKNGSAQRRGAGSGEQGAELRAEGRSAFSAQRSENQVTVAVTGAEAGVWVGTGNSISLGQSGTGLEEAVETAGYVEGSLV